MIKEFHDSLSQFKFQKSLFCVTAAFEETDALLIQLQKKMDCLQSDLYKDYQPEIRVSTLASSVNVVCFS